MIVKNSPSLRLLGLNTRILIFIFHPNRSRQQMSDSYRECTCTLLITSAVSQDSEAERSPIQHQFLPSLGALQLKWEAVQTMFDPVVKKVVDEIERLDSYVVLSRFKYLLFGWRLCCFSILAAGNTGEVLEGNSRTHP